MAHEIAHAETFAASTANGNLAFSVRKDTPVALASVDGQLQPLLTDADGRLLVSQAAGSAGLTDAELRATPVPVSGTVTASGPLTDTQLRASAVPTSLATLPALVAGTANIGDVDVLTLPNVTLAAGTNTNEVVGDVAQDAAAAGNPVLVAGSAETMADSAPANRVSADADACRLSVTDGALYTIPSGPQTWSYHENSSSALTDTVVHASPGVGLSLYVSTVVVSTGAATAFNIFFEEGAATVLGPYYLEAVAGRGLVIPFMTPKKITAATALTVTTSAAIAHSIDITGFIAPG